jgi:hypothetical protein
MTRELTIVGACDLCHAPAPHMHTFAIDGLTREIDLCEQHWSDLALSDLADTLTEHGRRPAKTSDDAPEVKRIPGERPRDPQTCPICGTISKNRGSLSAHLRSAHQTSLGVLAGRYEPTPCPECGKPFAHQGMTMHRRMIHGVDNAPPLPVDA